MIGVGSSRGIDTSLEVHVGPEDTVYVAYVMTVPGKPSYPWSSSENVIELVLLDITVQFLWSYPTLPPCNVSSPPCSFSGMWEVTPLGYSFAVSITFLREYMKPCNMVRWSRFPRHISRLRINVLYGESAVLDAIGIATHDGAKVGVICFGVVQVGNATVVA